MFPESLFETRHLGPDQEQIDAMLNRLNLKTMDELMNRVVPNSIRMKAKLNLPDPISEQELMREALELAGRNKQWRSYIGMGYYNTITPTTLIRNLFENAGWTTSYTPYQAEMSQGRMECLMVYQTMVSDMTGLDIANASLLDEGSAAAEAMSLAYSLTPRAKTNKRLFYVDRSVHPQTIAIVQTRAKAIGVEVEVLDWRRAEFDADRVCGILVQYPDTLGAVHDYSDMIHHAKKSHVLTICATDLLALSILKPPGELGFDVALGSAQRFGVPLGYGGPHAAFFAVNEPLVRYMPGRLIGITKDSAGLQAYRLTLQTREQHIRREKATSNICTAQALLANIAAMYSVYHGAQGLSKIAKRIHDMTRLIAKGVETAAAAAASSNSGGEGGGGSNEYELVNDTFFDTLTFKLSDPEQVAALRQRAEKREINFRYHDLESLNDSTAPLPHTNQISLSLDETVKDEDLKDILSIFQSTKSLEELYTEFITVSDSSGHPVSFYSNLVRSSPFLTHQIFKRYQSETNIVRYMKQMEKKDLSLTDSMIPLGSCTMKLNSATELMLASIPGFTNIHPFVWKPTQASGYHILINELEQYLLEISGYHKISFQPNSGAQGEYAGLQVIKAYLESKGQHKRNLCLIPVSAHGTNAASARMAAMDIKPLHVNAVGDICLEELEQVVCQSVS